MTAAEYKQRQFEIYAGNAAGWEQWAAIVAPQAEGFNRPLVEAAGIAPGHRVLDLASGAGEPALTVAQTVGPDGHVTATDYSPAMLGIVERRAQEAGLSNMSFEVTDMEVLPFDDARFDAVISRFGVMYSPDVERTFAECLRVLAPGGKAAHMVWGTIEANSLLWTVFDTANATTRQYTDDEARHPFRYAETGSVGPSMEKAGFAQVEEVDLHFSPAIPEGIPFWSPILGMNFGGAIDLMSDDERTALDARVKDAFAPFLKDGKYHVTAHVRIVVGARI